MRTVATVAAQVKKQLVDVPMDTDAFEEKLYFLDNRNYKRNQMPQESRLEKFIKDFVEKKISEKVYLYLDDAITLRPLDKTKESMFLAAFWAKILQHELNYPPASNKYRRKVVDSAERLDLETKEVKFTIYMNTGMMVMEGPFVYDWFTSKFRNMLNNFDKNFQKSWTFIPTVTGDLPEADIAIPDDYEKSETEAYLLLENRGQRIDSKFEEKLRQHSKCIVENVGDLSLSVPKPAWSAVELKRQLESMKHGGIYTTSIYLYPLWNSLLRHWFRRRNARIYISSPHLDAERFQELIEIVLDYESVATLSAFYVNFLCDPESSLNVGALQKNALKRCAGNRQRTDVEFRVFRCMIYPLKKLLSAFVVLVNDDDGSAEVLLTSANYHGMHLTCDGAAFAIYNIMTEEEFQKRYVQPLEISSPALSTLAK